MKPHRHVENSTRRRALFPPDENSSDSGLGCISPLNFDDVSVKNDEIFSLNKRVGDYDIIGLVEKTNPVGTPKSSLNDGSKFFSSTPQHVTNLTDESPTQKLKTPHDTSTKISLPKLIRKTDTTLTASPISPQTQPDIDSNKSKVRTALFPDMSIPSKTFYPMTQTPVTSSHFSVIENKSPKKPSRKRKPYLCNRSRRITGQINAGVRHRVKRLKKTKKNAAIRGKICKIMKDYVTDNILEKPKNMNIPEDSMSLDILQNTVSTECPQEPPSPEIDPNKKFFKSSKRKGVVTVNQNMKLEINNGKITFMNGQKRSRGQGGICPKKIKLNNDFDINLDEPFEETLIPPSDISNVISLLEDKENVTEKNDSAVLMSPTSQMCNMTSGLALNSPKKMKNLNPILETMIEPSQEKQLYPIFYPGKSQVSLNANNSKSFNNNTKKFKGLSKGQMLLDAGQKKFGVTQCSECKIVYHMGDPGDEIMHLNYHNATHIFKFHGWKNERVVYVDHVEGRIIQIVPTDSKVWWNKVNDVMEVINRDLGFYDIEFKTLNSQIFFYIKNKTIMGALVAEAKDTAYKLLTTDQNEVDLCSEESYGIKCGVSRIWVSQNHRKKGIATALMDTLKRSFMSGYVLTDDDIALSTPTEMGKIFGKKYFKTPNFLIYFV